jgi:cyclic-di-GMP-binding protein
MPTFDVVSELDMQEVRNAVDQAQREIATRYDFKNTGSSIELTEKTIELNTESDARLQALTQVLEEKLVKRKVSLKALAFGKIEEASKGAVRQTVTLNVGISTDKAKEIGKFVKELGLKGVSHQVQGDQLRISGKKRDDLQAAIAALREHDFEVPLQFTNFRD